MKIKVIKYNNFKMPVRAHYNDSGADVFATAAYTIKPNEIKALATGVGIELPDGYDAIIACKSSLSSNGLIAMNAPIDSGYRGEIHTILANISDHDICIEQGQKIGQIVVRPVIYCDFVEQFDCQREGNAFGSTGK